MPSSDAEEEAEFRREQSARPDGSAPPSSRNPALDRLKLAGDMQEYHEKGRPKVSDFKPKGWQRALAAAANFGAGYVNAGGRVKVDPGSMQNINQSLLRPGYNKAVEKWQDQGIQSDAEMRGATRDYKLSEAEREAGIDAQRAKTAQESAAATLEWRKAQAERANHPQPEFINTPRGMASSKTGQLVDPLPVRPLPETPAQAQTRRRGEIESGQFRSLTPEQKDAYALTGRIPAKPRPPAAKQGRSNIGTPGQSLAVQNRKAAALQSAEAAHLKRMKDGIPEASSLAILEEAKRSAMAGYDAGVQALGGTVVPRGGPPSPPPSAAPAPATAPKIKMRTEAQARAEAMAAGRDPDAVVEMLRKAGGIL